MEDSQGRPSVGQRAPPVAGAKRASDGDAASGLSRQEKRRAHTDQWDPTGERRQACYKHQLGQRVRAVEQREADVRSSKERLVRREAVNDARTKRAFHHAQEKYDTGERTQRAANDFVYGKSGERFASLLDAGLSVLKRLQDTRQLEDGDAMRLAVARVLEFKHPELLPPIPVGAAVFYFKGDACWAATVVGVSGCDAQGVPAEYTLQLPPRCKEDGGRIVNTAGRAEITRSAF